MTTISEFINKNKSLFIKVTELEYLVFGTFPNNFLNKPININVSQKKRGLILSINNGKIVIMINNIFRNSGGGKSRKKRGQGKAKKARSRRRANCKAAKEDEMLYEASMKKWRRDNKIKNVMSICLLIIIYVIYKNINFGYIELRDNPWEVDSTDIDVLFNKVIPVINLRNINISMQLLNDSLTRGLTSNNTQQITKLPMNINLKPLSYAEFNISRFPAHTEMFNMFKNVSFTKKKYASGGPPEFRILGIWRLSNSGLVNIELLDPIISGSMFKFPNRRDVEERILNFVTESIQIQKKLGMIRKDENEGQFRFILANFPPILGNGENPVIHYDGMGSIRDISKKAYTGRNPDIGGIISLIYIEASEISQPSITVDEEGNPIPDPIQHGEKKGRNSVKTKYIEGKPTLGQVQIHDQSQSVKHEAVGTEAVRRRLLNLQILPVQLTDAPFTAVKKREKAGGRKKRKTRKKKRRKKRTRRY